MATAGRRGLGSGGLLRAFARLFLLIGLGFGAGLAIGILAEQPSLWMAYLRGESETISIAGEAESADPTAAHADADSDAANSVPADLEKRMARVREQTARAESLAYANATESVRPFAVAEAPEPLPPVAAAAPARRPSVPSPPDVSPGSAGTPPETGAAPRWSIQVGAFADESVARRLVSNLEAKRYPAVLVPTSDEAGSAKRWRVRVQPIESESEARGLASRLKRDERLPTWLIPIEAPTRP